jgi:hypothetical protein
MWRYRERLNYFEKLRRSLYEILRDSLERRLMKISLVDSFYNFQKAGAEYSFLDKSELKPKSKKVEKESELFRTFIVIFYEDILDPSIKNHIRFFPENAVFKKNLQYQILFPLYEEFNRNLKYFDNPRFLDFIEGLLDVDYALLIQQDPTIKKKNRYALTHYHVKIDWPIADAAEDLAKWLRYIQNNLYEKGDTYARALQNKLFEYYGCHHSVGGRRTAGLIAAQLLSSQTSIGTVFISSAQSRSMYKYSERGFSKFFLIQLSQKQIEALAQRERIDAEVLKSTYLYPAGDFFVGIAEASYGRTVHSKPPDDGKLRRLKPAYNWLKLRDEFLHPNVSSLTAGPISYKWVYATGE